MPQTHQPAGLSRFSDMLKAALGPLVDQEASGFLDMMAPDGVMEFPYAPPGGVTRLEGREALAAYLSGYDEILAIGRMTEPTIYRTDNPEVVILEFGCIGHGVKTGRPYNQRYISVVTVRDGKIVRYVDYWNPLIALEAIGGMDALTAALGAGGRS